MAIAVEHQDALRVGTPTVASGAILVYVDRRHECPGSDQLLLERLLLTDGARWQQYQAQGRDRRQTENETSVHRILPDVEYFLATVGAGRAVKSPQNYGLSESPADSMVAARCAARIRHIPLQGAAI